MYKIAENGVIRLSDGAYIPNNPSNRDWNAYQDWLATDPSNNIAAEQYTVAELKAAKKIEIDRLRDDAINGGVTHNGYDFDSDVTSRSNLNGAMTSVNGGNALPAGFVWRTSDNQNLPFTSTQLMALGDAMIVHVNNAYTQSWQLKFDVDAVDDNADVATATAQLDAIVWV